MMELLNIEALRPGVNGNNPDGTNAANYDESKANPYPNLPDPLVLKNGRKVTAPRCGGTSAAGNRRRFRSRNLRPGARRMLPTGELGS